MFCNAGESLNPHRSGAPARSAPRSWGDRHTRKSLRPKLKIPETGDFFVLRPRIPRAPAEGAPAQLAGQRAARRCATFDFLSQRAIATGLREPRNGAARSLVCTTRLVCTTSRRKARRREGDK